ncbi:hypothetical protein GGI00_003935 [Coemansia sp. RSA 2681]|nr:hypothetical protein GGI00_003935 [Coemansia sp. RSA 2681]
MTRFNIRVASEGNCGDKTACRPVIGAMSGIVIMLSEFAAPGAEGEPSGVVGSINEDADGDDASDDTDRSDRPRGRDLGDVVEAMLPPRCSGGTFRDFKELGEAISL